MYSRAIININVSRLRYFSFPIVHGTVLAMQPQEGYSELLSLPTPPSTGRRFQAQDNAFPGMPDNQESPKLFHLRLRFPTKQLSKNNMTDKRT